jgi:phospholipase A2
VRIGYTPSDQEKIYVQDREKIVREFLKIDQDKPCPHIALVASGGGVRAMLSTLGSLHGLEESGLLNAITYVTRIR